MVSLPCLAATTDLPWQTMAVAKTLLHLPTVNPNIPHDFCGQNFEQTNFAELFNQNSGANFAKFPPECRERGVDIDTIKIRLGEIDDPEKGYDHPSVECLHFFYLDEFAFNGALSPPAREGFRYGPPRFPRGYYLSPKHSTSQTSVCISEFVDGIPLQWHVSNLASGREVADFLLAMLDLLIVLSEKSIMHRDIHPSNIVVSKEWASDGSVQYRITLLDFTWAVSPGIVQYGSPPSFFNDIYGHPFKSSDVYSVGYVVHDMLSMYCDIDTSWVSPIIKEMMDSIPPLQLSFTNKPGLEALKQRVESLLALKELSLLQEKRNPGMYKSCD